jgi:nucleoside-triphosphatase THEP1
MTNNKTKIGVSRRIGDEYQDNTALKLALELYHKRKDFKLFIEYEQAVSMDDIVIMHNDNVDAYQVKYSINPNEVYTIDHFLNPESNVYLRKFVDSWISLKHQYPNKKLTLNLFTNRSLDVDLSKLINKDGNFLKKFIDGRQYMLPRQIRQKLLTISMLEDDDFKDFLSCFCFKIKQLDLNNLIEYIKGTLLDHYLGISEPSIYDSLIKLIKEFAIFRRDALTPKDIDEFIKNTQSRYLSPQKFVVDESFYVKREMLKSRLDTAIKDTEKGYIIITGLPGSGKTTSLTIYFDELERSKNNLIVRYYCFIDINDNFRKQRIEAKSLRINLISLLQDKFHKIIPRTFDFTENNFYQVLKTLCEHFANNNQKLIIFIDGLDHAERMESRIQENIKEALPTELPKGVIIVISTQELHKWPIFLEEIRKNPKTHIELSLFTLIETKEFLIKNKINNLTDTQVVDIHHKCEGLPLYLKYIVDRIRDAKDISEELEKMPILADGDIKKYYEMIWQEFDSSEKIFTKHLCGVLACLQFPVNKDELFAFQKDLDHANFITCFRMIQHLLKQWRGKVEIFHNSFREFVLLKLDSDWKQSIYSKIIEHLKSQENSILWFNHVFDYAYRAKDYNYAIDKVNRKFVDNALSYFYPNKVIEKAIYWAVESAKEKSDVLALCRLSALKLKTWERIEYHLGKNLLLKILLALDKEEDVIRYSFSSHQNQWFIDLSTALNLLKELPNYNKKELGKKLFLAAMTSFAEARLENKSDIINYSYCQGIYSKSLDSQLKWQSQVKLQPDPIETKQPYIPDYVPHLEAYIDAIIRYQPVQYWEKIKKTNRYFSNQLIHYLLIRSIARSIRYHSNYKEILKNEINEYISQFKSASNPELAFYAALSGLPNEVITSIIGNIALPPLDAPDPLFRNNPILHKYRMTFIVLGYKCKKESIEEIKKHLIKRESWWTSYFLYLLQVGECIGKYLSQRKDDWFNTAINSIDILAQIKKAERERTAELIELCRDELIESLFWLTKAVGERYPEHLKEWFERLKSLQDSNLWTDQYGYGELIEDYTFELKIYEKLSSLKNCQRYIIELLKICDDKFKKSSLIKGSSRSEHFLRLALIAAHCGFMNEAKKWLQYGIKATLIYGYRKDMTLYQLIDILGLINKHKPELALERCAEILELVDWMPHLTDNAETRYFPKKIFEQVAKVNKTAALKLLSLYVKNKARWQMQDSLESLLEQIQEADPEILWTLTSVFVNDFSRDGRHFKQSINSKQQVIRIANQHGNTQIINKLKRDLDHFIRTNVPPRYWHELVSGYWQLQPKSLHEINHLPREKDTIEDQNKIYRLNNKSVIIQEIKEHLFKSFRDFKITIQKLKDENPNFYESALIEAALEFHINKVNKAEETSELLAIKDYIEKEITWKEDLLRKLGDKFIGFGEVENGLKCFEIAYSNTIEFFRWKINKNDFTIIAEHDRRRAENLLINVCYQSLEKFSGYDLPSLVACAFDILGDIDKLNEVYLSYLKHTKELFEHLPKQNEYSWLKDYVSEKDDFNELAINFIVDELCSIEIDLGNRLIDACREFCLLKPEIVLPIFIKRLSNADELTRSRLLIIFYMIAYDSPNLLIPYAEEISKFLDLKHFQMKMTVMKTLQLIEQVNSIPESVKKRLKIAQQHFFPTICRQSYKMLDIQASNKFLNFFKKNVVKTIQLQIESCCKVLSINEDNVLAKIENMLKQTGWTEEKEREKLKDEWNGYIHPQGYPRVWIFQFFDLRVFNVFNQILDDIIENSSLASNEIEALWRILQPADPEYKLSSIKPKPNDIERLIVSNKDAWLSELHNTQGKVIPKQITNEWITIFEERILSQDEEYNVPYSSRLLLYSSLIKKGLSLSFEELEKECAKIFMLKKYDDNEFITLEQARDLILNEKWTGILQQNSSLPILIWKTNSPLFYGYHEVVSLPQYLIKQYALEYRNFELYTKNKCMVKYEVWQEGYVDETYSRELLSFGTRLLINKSLLENIFNDYNFELCQSISENRVYYSRIKKNPDEMNHSTNIIIIHN